MKTLQSLVDTQLPMNRKEVFFTATVLPMIIAKDNFQYLPLLLNALEILPVPEIVVQLPYTNIQFFTEYNLFRALNGTGREKEFQIGEDSIPEDTPDLMILIDTPDNKTLLIALEAKMFSQPSVVDIAIQMGKQKKMLDIVKQALGLEYHHFALLPQKLAEKVEIKDKVITWETVRDLFEPVAKDDYFMNILKIALDSYATLASSYESSYGKNNENRMTGQEIYDRFKENILENQSMGRDKGLNGLVLKKDLENGGWKTQRYETRKSGIPNCNWFAVEAFVKRIDSL